MPAVSVIIPTHNRAQFLSEAIDSVFAQTYQDWELIVVDDGSTDATPDVVQRYGQRGHPVRYHHQTPQGPGAARNAGLALATGEFIAFLDDDDLWLPKKLGTQVGYLRHHPDAGFVYCPMQILEPDGRWGGRKPSAVHEPTWEALLRHSFIPPSVVARRVCFDTCGAFAEGLAVAEDYDLWLRVGRQFPFGATTEPLAVYRRHGANVTRQMTSRSYECHVQIFQRLREDTVSSHGHRAIVDARLAKEWHLLGKAYLEERRYAEACEAFLHEIGLNPFGGLAFVSVGDSLRQRFAKLSKPYLATAYAALAAMRMR